MYIRHKKGICRYLNNLKIDTFKKDETKGVSAFIYGK